MKMAPHFDSQSKMDIESFFGYCTEGMETDSEKLLATLFLKALNKKIHSEPIGENIYLGKFEISQIQLFDILIDKFPFVRYSQKITNEVIIKAMQGCEEVTLVDIGIGMGTQMLNLIALAAQLPQLKKLHFVGIEPFGDALKKAESGILAQNGKVPFEIEFTGIEEVAEKVDFSAIPNVKGKVIVNASLALHHIQSDELRRRTIAGIKQLNPDAFLLIEPNSNHYEPDFFKRFQNCYNHFNAIFQVIDQIQMISNQEKNALKLFFGREIEDIIGKDDKDRYEKHELASTWIARLEDNDFSISEAFENFPTDAGSGVAIRYHPEGFLGFTHENETVLAVICAN